MTQTIIALSGDRPKGVQITLRDVLIFKILSSGIATPSQILCELRKFDGMSGVTMAALLVRISAVTRAGYLVSRRYQNRNGRGNFALYGLAEHGIVVLCEEGYPRDLIRANMPNAFTVTHELLVTDAVRTLKREYSEGLYELSIRDENTLREMLPRLRAYPDLVIWITLISNGKRKVKRICMEIDNNTHLAHRVVAKVKLLSKYIFIFLCPTRRRIDTLIGAFSRTNDTALCERVIFGLAYDFTMYGLENTHFVDANRTLITVLRRDISSRNS